MCARRTSFLRLRVFNYSGIATFRQDKRWPKLNPFTVKKSSVTHCSNCSSKYFLPRCAPAPEQVYSRCKINKSNNRKDEAAREQSVEHVDRCNARHNPRQGEHRPANAVVEGVGENNLKHRHSA